MRQKIRIYNPYDLDIIALTEAKGFSVANAMRETLRYYAEGKRHLIELPNLPETLKNDNYVKGFYVELDDDRDQEAINFLMAIPSGLRNSFMKNIFRASLEMCPMSLYLGKGGAEYVAKMIANRRYGRYPVQREVIDPIELADGEIRAIVSNTSPDVSQLPKGQTKSEAKYKKPSNKDKLRKLTQQAYEHADKKQEEKLTQRNQLLQNKNNDAQNDLDSLLDSMM